MSMQEFIVKIGAGQKTSKDLTWDEAKRAMRLLIEGQATPAQVGAFLMAMRFKMESVTELAAFTAAAREYAPPLSVAHNLSLVDLPIYAGKQDSFHASIGAAVVAAAGGAAILMHGHDIIPARPGPASVLAKLGISTELSVTQVGDELAAKGFAYLDIALYHPAIARFLQLRQELGLRTLFHPVVRMLNPARARSQIIGLTHPPYFDKMGEALAMLGCQQALIIRGVEGNPELSIASATKVLEFRGDRITPLTLHPKDAGLPLGTFQHMAGFAVEQIDKEADLLRRILHNQVQGGQRDWVMLNAGLLLYAAGKAASIQAGTKLAQQVIESGAAARKLVELVPSEQLSTMDR